LAFVGGRTRVPSRRVSQATFAALPPTAQVGHVAPETTTGTAVYPFAIVGTKVEGERAWANGRMLVARRNEILNVFSSGKNLVGSNNSCESAAITAAKKTTKDNTKSNISSSSSSNSNNNQQQPATGPTSKQVSQSASRQAGKPHLSRRVCVRQNNLLSVRMHVPVDLDIATCCGNVVAGGNHARF
jgi:hypothetical protein